MKIKQWSDSGYGAPGYLIRTFRGPRFTIALDQTSGRKIAEELKTLSEAMTEYLDVCDAEGRAI